MTATGSGVAWRRGVAAASAMADDPWPARLDRTVLVVRIQPARGRRLGAPARLAGPLLLAAVAVLVYHLPRATRLLEYDRGAILGGQLWRLLTGHWTHASFDHLALDVVAFAALGVAVAWRGAALFWRTVLAAAVAISAALLLLAPRWETYRGLSGIDSALFVALAAWLWLQGRGGRDRWLGAGALLLFVGKVSYEALTGSALFASETAGHQVVPLAHVTGALAGLAAAAWICAPALSARRTPRHHRGHRRRRPAAPRSPGG